MPGAESKSGSSQTYTDVSTLDAIVKSGDVALLRADFVRGLEGPMARRQDLPAEAFYAGGITEELVVVALSYGWITPDHPDPECFHLRTVQKVLEHFSHTCREDRQAFDTQQRVVSGDRTAAYEGREVVVFWDWPCLYQDKPKGSRTKKQTEAFKRALGSVNLWYAHAHTHVWMLTKTPDSVERTYGMRGWCRFEQGVSQLISPSQTVLDLGMFSGNAEDYDANFWHTPVLVDGGLKSIMWAPPEELHGGLAEKCAAGRLVPQTPEQMSALLDELTFTNGKTDTQLVQGLYAETFAEVMGHVGELSWNDQSWNVDLSVFFPVLEPCNALRTLDLSGNGLRGDLSGLVSFIDGHLRSLESLNLSANQLSGILPLELIRKKAQGLKLLLKDNGGFTLPRNLGDLGEEVTVLDLSNCSLTGTIPRSILQLTRLQKLCLGTSVPRTHALQPQSPVKRTLEDDPLDESAISAEELKLKLGDCEVNLGIRPVRVNPGDEGCLCCVL